MTPRFDEVELQKDPLSDVEGPKEFIAAPRRESGRLRRFLATAIDLSIFAALGLALSPLLPLQPTLSATITHAAVPLAGLTLFLLLMSFYYFAGCWTLWGKTVGGTIFETRVVSEDFDKVSLGAASVRWLGTIISLLTAGIGFFIAALPGARSLPDRMSRTQVVLDTRG